MNNSIEGPDNSAATSSLGNEFHRASRVEAWGAMQHEQFLRMLDKNPQILPETIAPDAPDAPDTVEPDFSHGDCNGGDEYDHRVEQGAASRATLESVMGMPRIKHSPGLKGY